ncbi:MAG: hypothetical protein M3Z24_08610 [Chloroflexota bacterium]|nr:hypothetical protein [Chloroflexota bacterium]
MKVYDSNQHSVGDVNQYGTVTNDDGRKVGDVSEDGTVIDGYGRHAGNVSEDGAITDNDNRKVGDVEMSDEGNICFAGGAAFLLLLKPKN